MNTVSVCLVTGEFSPITGGVGDYTRELARGLAQKGAKPFILTSVRAQATGTPSLLLFPAISRWDFSSLGKVAAIVRQTHPQVLHIQYQAAAYGLHTAIHLLPYRIKRLPRHPKTLVTFHDLRVPYLFPKAGPLRGFALRFLAQGCDGVIFTADEDAQIARNWGLKQPVATIPIGSNIPPTSPPGYSREEWRKMLGVGPGETLLSYFGFLNQSKGGEDLIYALKILVERGRAMKLLMVGETEKGSDLTNREYAKKVRRLISEMGLGQRVLWTGYLEEERISAHLLATDICVLPYRDGLSLRRGALQAALAHGLAIISTLPQTPIPEIVDGENVALVAAADPISLAAKIETLMQSPELRSRLSRGSKKLAIAFTWDKIVEKTFEFYQQVLTG